MVGAAVCITTAPELPRTWAQATRQAATAAGNLAAEATGQSAKPFDLPAARRLAAFNLPDLGGTALLARGGRLIATGRLPHLINRRVDRKNLRSVRP